MKYLGTTTVVVIFLAALAAQGVTKYDLRYRLDAGSALTVTLSQKMRHQRTVMGNEFATSTEDAIVWGIEPTSGGNDGVLLDVVYRDRTHATDSPLQQSGPDFADLLGRHVEMRMSPRGVLSGFQGFEDLPEIRFADLDATLNKELYIRELHDAFLEFPDRPVAVGEDWSYAREFSDPAADSDVRVRQNFKYTVVGTTVVDGQECLELEGKISVTVDGVIKAGGMDLVLRIGGGGQETAYFAWKRGFVLRSDGEAHIEGIAQDEELGVTITLSQDVETSLRAAFE